MIGPLLNIRKISFQIIWEKEQLQHRKHNKDLDENYFPQGFTYGHPTEAVSIKAIYFSGVLRYHIHLVVETRLFQLYVTGKECTQLVTKNPKEDTK